MYKKIYVPLILALVAALAFSNVAYAATDSTTANASIRRVGTIRSIDASNYTIRVATTKGENMTFHLNSSTVYRGLASSFADLTASMKVNVTATQTTSGYYLATIVNVINSNVKVKMKGDVTFVGSNTFTILGTDGNSYTFTVSKNTVFSGQDVTDITGLAVGMTVKITYTKSGDLLRALNVVVTAVNVKIDGKVTKVSSSSFAILATDGNTYTFQVTSNTTFTGLGVDSLSKLDKGMKVRVTYTVRDDGTYRAVKVITRKLAS